MGRRRGTNKGEATHSNRKYKIWQRTFCDGCHAHSNGAGAYISSAPQAAIVAPRIGISNHGRRPTPSPCVEANAQLSSIELRVSHSVFLSTQIAFISFLFVEDVIRQFSYVYRPQMCAPKAENGPQEPSRSSQVLGHFTQRPHRALKRSNPRTNASPRPETRESSILHNVT